MTMKKRVVIVGAGPCGLAALKEALEAGHDAVCFERSGVLGGSFASTSSKFYLTVSNWFMAFSDFPPKQDLCYSTAREYLEYLQAYVRHFDLERHIQYHTEITRAKLLQGNGRDTWELSIRPTKPRYARNIDERVLADALIVATGANQKAKEVPESLRGFTGEIIHSSNVGDDFKSRVARKGSRVLLIGGGESGADIAADLGELSPNVTVWLKRAPYVAPRYHRSDRELNSIEMNRMSSKAYPPLAFAEAATTSRIQAGISIYAHGLFSRALLYAPGLMNDVSRRWGQEHTKDSYFKCAYATYVTKNARMAEAVQHGEIRAIIGGSVALAPNSNGRAVVFEALDGKMLKLNFDAVVLCTGYQAEFPWLHVPPGQEALVQAPNPREWYLHCFPPNLGHCLFFVGYARPHQGGIPAGAEMLSRYIALLLRNDVSLPDDYSVRPLDDERIERQRYSLSPDLDSLVDYNAFMESVARRIGCEPRLPVLLVLAFNIHIVSVFLALLRCFFFVALGDTRGSAKVPSIWTLMALSTFSAAVFVFYEDGWMLKWWFYPQWSTWYRQRGPGANPALLSAMLARVPLRKCFSLRRGIAKQVFFYGILFGFHVPPFYVQRPLSVIVFVMDSVITMLGVRVKWMLGTLQLLRPGVYALHDTPWRPEDLVLP